MNEWSLQKKRFWKGRIPNAYNKNDSSNVDSFLEKSKLHPNQLHHSKKEVFFNKKRIWLKKEIADSFEKKLELKSTKSHQHSFDSKLEFAHIQINCSISSFSSFENEKKNWIESWFQTFFEEFWMFDDVDFQFISKNFF